MRYTLLPPWILPRQKNLAESLDCAPAGALRQVYNLRPILCALTVMLSLAKGTPMKPLIAALLLALVAVPAMAGDAVDTSFVKTQGPHPFNVRDLVMMQRVSDPQLSPDGRYAAFGVRSTDYAANKGINTVYVLDLSGNGSQPVKVVDKAGSARWSTDGHSLYFVAPAKGVAQLWRLDPAGFVPLVLAMLVGTPSLSLFGAIGAALTLGARRGGALVALLVLPLVLPVLIFGVGAVEAAVTGLGARPHLLILGALLAAALPLAPLAAAVALRQALESA